MTVRLWYPQLDVYDTIRRMSLIINRIDSGLLSNERACILDFYLANPPLLHLTRMDQLVRYQFNILKIPRPERVFISYPSAAILFARMEPVQTEALRTLGAKGVIDFDAAGVQPVRITTEGQRVLNSKFASLIASAEAPLLDFLVSHFAFMSLGLPGGLRSHTKLRRLGA